jgi:hypothetical protein
VVFILFYLDLQISLNGFENKQIKEKKEEGHTCAAGGLEARSAGLSPRFPVAGPTRPSPLFPAPAWAGPGEHRVSSLFSSATNTVAPLVGRLVLFLVAETETITDSDPNPRTKGLFSQIDHANTLYKLEPSLACRF